MTATTHAIDVDLEIADTLRQQLGSQKYAMWFDGSSRFAYCEQDRKLTVTVANQFSRNWIERHFSSDLRSAALQATGQEVALNLCVMDDAASEMSEPAGAPTSSAPSTPSADVGAPIAFPSPVEQPIARNHANLRAASNSYKHRLSQFVTGPSNQLAYAAAQRAADLSDPTANHPLFLHGTCGVGKTHLLQGICAQAKRQHPDAKVVYMTAEQFTNDFISAVRTNKLDTFRRKIRRLDLLAIDDVHFFACKEKTQIEFLCCFEENDLAGARIVLASDSHPKQISSFSDALISRCVCGLVVEMKEPDHDTRRAVLMELARRRGLMLQPAVADLIGQRYDGSVRELEGVLAQLHALASLPQRGRLYGHPAPNTPLLVGRELVEQLPEFNAPTVRKPVRFTNIVKAVCEQLAVEPSQLAGSSRHKALVLARSLSVYIARELTTMSYPEIAYAMGRKNHSTVITADHRIRRQMEIDDPIMLPAGAGSVTPSELAQSLTRQVLQSAA